MNRDQERALWALDKATKDLNRRKGGTRVETIYAQAYQTCVRLGIKPQIRKKYR